MKKIFILLLLFCLSSHSIAKVGDIYSCSENAIVISNEAEGALDSNYLSDFSFRRTKDEIIFEKYKRFSSKFNMQIILDSLEVFTASGGRFAGDDLPVHSFLSYMDGRFTYSNYLYLPTEVLITTTTAKCFITNPS